MDTGTVWYLRRQPDFGHNENCHADATPEEAARALARAAEHALPGGQGAAVWLGTDLLAAAEHDSLCGVVVRIVPGLRHRVALPWRIGGQQK